MEKDKVIATLRTSEPALRQLGVDHAALFGSLARDDAKADSDIDIMIESDPTYPLTLYDYVGVKDYIASLFSRRVDVVDKAGLKLSVAPSARAAAVNAF